MANYTSHVGAKRNVDGKLMGAVHFTLLHFTLLHEVDQEWKKKKKVYTIKLSIAITVSDTICDQHIIVEDIGYGRLFPIGNHFGLIGNLDVTA